MKQSTRRLVAEVGRATGPLLAAALRALEDLLAARRQVPKPPLGLSLASPWPLPHLTLASLLAARRQVPNASTCAPCVACSLQHRW